MSEPYVGEVRLVGFTFPPPGWLACDGSLVSISNYETLFNLIGTTYGGDGQTTFGLPDLRGHVAAGMGTLSSTLAIGQTLGAESVTLNATQTAAHTHFLTAASTGNASTPSSATVLAATTPSADLQVNGYLPPTGATLGAMASSIGVATPSGGASHENRQPFLTINFIIAVEGVFPSQN